MSSQRLKQVAVSGLRLYLWFALAQFFIGITVGAALALGGVDVQTLVDGLR